MSIMHRCHDKERLVEYVYGEIEDGARAEIDAHLLSCTACARELEGLHETRRGLAGWLPPEPDLGFTLVQKAAVTPPRAAWAWGGLPAWAQVAAATLVVASGLAIANVRVQYGADGLVVTTGWMASSETTEDAARAPQRAAAEAARPAQADEWRQALAALEADVQQQLAALRATEAAAPATTSVDPAAILRQVNRLIEESEQRQQQQLAFRLTQFGRDVEMQRRADLLRIEQGLGQLDARTIAELERQRRESRQLTNYLMRVSTRPVP